MAATKYKVHLAFKHAHFEKAFIVTTVYADSDDRAIEQAKRKIKRQIFGFIEWEKVSIVYE